MPRTIESLVECHRVTRERARHGKGPWDHHVPIKDILAPLKARRAAGETLDDACLAEACCAVADLLKARLPARLFDLTHDDYDRDLDEIYEGLADMTAASFSEDPSYSLTQHLDGKLDELYDWGDRARVWLG